MSKKDKQTSTTTSTTAPPEFILNELQNALSETRNRYEAGPTREFYPDSTVVPFSEDTIASMGSLRDIVGSGPSEASMAGYETLRDILGS